MKIIYAGIRHENYNPERGMSFEYNNFYLTLKSMEGVAVLEVPLDDIAKKGKAQFNKELLDMVRREKPDFFFSFMFSDELDFETLDAIKKETVSVGWFADDHWRLHNYSRHYVPHFTWGITTWSKAPAIYASYGIANVMRSQWACSLDIKKIIEEQKDIDVSFIGQRTESREKIIKALQFAGIRVYVRGWGWPEGKLTEEEMAHVISRSKINLNLNAPPSRFSPRSLARILFRRSCGKFVFDPHIVDNIRSWWGMATPQIKARPFEMIGRGAFLISGTADDMESYYEDKKEIVYYDGSITDLVGKAKYYLAHPSECDAIRRAGYARTREEHTYVRRFQEIFTRIKT